MISVRTVADLNAYNDRPLPNGAQMYMETSGPYYIWQLDRASTAAVDNLFTVLPSSGVGRWLRVLPSSGGGGGGIVTLAGDAVGPSDDNVVEGLITIPIDQTRQPAADDVLSYNGTSLVFGPLPVAFNISSFSIGASAMQEIGASVVNPFVSASYTSAATSASVSNNDYQPTVTLNAPYTGGQIPYTFTKNFNNLSVIFTLTALRGTTQRTATTTIRWGTRLFWGANASPSGATEAFIEGLSSSLVTTARAGTYTISAGTTLYSYFCLPDSFGTPVFTIGGFETTFALVASGVPVTNNYGQVTNYSVWRSNVAGLGIFNLVVT